MTVWACVASGPSLRQADVDMLRDRVRVLVINDNYQLAPWADAIYAADLSWWHKHFDRVSPDFEGRMYSIENNSDPKNPRLAEQLYGLKLFSVEPNKDLTHIGLSRAPGVLRTGGLSGYQGINILYHWGADVVLPLGFDCQHTYGKRHWFGDHPQPLNNSSNLENRVKDFATIKPEDYGMKIINVTRQSALTCWPHMRLEEALEQYA